LKQQEMAGMIIDLRGNGGGYLEEAAKFLGHFIPKGEIVVKSEYQAFRPVDLPSEGRGELSTIPTVIIIDQLTASAGEIIALTLQEKGIPIIGMPSFGKGTIQAFTELPDGSSLKYTIGKRFSPAHTSINETGVLPDTTVERKSDVYLASGFDTQLEAAKIELQKLIEKKQRI
jgi:carboxyl-terminal processing protease